MSIISALLTVAKNRILLSSGISMVVGVDPDAAKSIPSQLGVYCVPSIVL